MNLQEMNYMLSLSVLATDLKSTQDIRGILLAIFPNNDIKYEVNKARAQIFAAETGQALTWSIAKDKPSNNV